MGWKREELVSDQAWTYGMSYRKHELMHKQPARGFKLTGRGSSSSTVPFCTDSSAPPSLWWWRWWCFFFFFFFSLSSFSFFCFFFLCLEDFFSWRTKMKKKTKKNRWFIIWKKNNWSGVATFTKWNKNSVISLKQTWEKKQPMCCTLSGPCELEYRA